MAYQALYRKFRPETFDDVKGQDPIVKTLTNQIKSDRIGHAYLFCGTRGTGKTSVAKILARAINCEHPVDGNPCNECAVCKSILSGASMNVMEIDAASNNGVDSIRRIVDEVRYSPTEGSYRVYIIDEVHSLSIGAFNALLKTLEEPPSYVVFILATTEAHMIPITILSRCQRYDFKRISLNVITDRLKELCTKEGIEYENEALKYVAKCGEGSMRDSLSLLERCVAFYFGEKLTYDKVIDILGTTEVDVFAELLRSIKNENVENCMKIIEEQVVEGKDLSRFVVDFTWYMRNLLLASGDRDISELLEVSREQMEILNCESKIYDHGMLMRYISLCCELTNRLRYATQKRVLIETEIIKMCRPQLEENNAALADRIRILEEQLSEIKKKGFIPEENPADPKKEAQEAEYVYVPEALPEDIKEVVDIWPEIRKEVDNPYRNFLINSTLSITPDGELLIIFKDDMGYKYVSDPNETGRKEIVPNIIKKKIQKQVKVKYDLENKDGGTNKKVHVNLENLMARFANVPIEVR